MRLSGGLLPRRAASSGGRSADGLEGGRGDGPPAGRRTAGRHAEAEVPGFLQRTVHPQPGEERKIPGRRPAGLQRRPDGLCHARSDGDTPLLRRAGRQHPVPVYPLPVASRGVRQHVGDRFLRSLGPETRWTDHRHGGELLESGQRQVQALRRRPADLFQCTPGVSVLGRNGFRYASDVGQRHVPAAQRRQFHPGGRALRAVLLPRRGVRLARPADRGQDPRTAVRGGSRECLAAVEEPLKGKDERIFTYEDGRQVWW